MNLSLAATKRERSREEEIANSISHGLGLIAALVATPFLIQHAVRHGDAGFIVGASIFAATPPGTAATPEERPWARRPGEGRSRRSSGCFSAAARLVIRMLKNVQQQTNVSVRKAFLDIGVSVELSIEKASS